MGNEESTPAQVAGQANTNVIVESPVEKIDIFHSVVLLLLLAILVTQVIYVGFRQYQRRMKRKYLERVRDSRAKI